MKIRTKLIQILEQNLQTIFSQNIKETVDFLENYQISPQLVEQVDALVFDVLLKDKEQNTQDMTLYNAIVDEQLTQLQPIQVKLLKALPYLFCLPPKDALVFLTKIAGLITSTHTGVSMLSMQLLRDQVKKSYECNVGLTDTLRTAGTITQINEA